MSIKRVAEFFAKKKGISSKQAKEDIEMMVSSIIDVLMEDGKVFIRNFGGFKKINTKPKVIRLPGSDEIINVGPGVRMGFQASPKVIAMLKGEKVGDDDGEE